MDDLITVKEYAETHGKSVQAVYKQLKSKENAEKLKGHIHERKISGKTVKYLDADAVKILEGASAQSPQIIIESQDRARMEELERENENLKIKIMELQEQMLSEMMRQNKRIEELTDKVLLLTETPKKKWKWWK